MPVLMLLIAQALGDSQAMAARPKAAGSWQLHDMHTSQFIYSK